MRGYFKAFTLLEIIMVLVILGILSTIGLLNLGRAVEKQRGKEAEMNLMLLYNAQNRYLLDKRSYFLCPSCTPASIAANLKIMLTPNYFDLSIVNNPSSPNNEGYLAIATRKDGPCKGMNMTMNETASFVRKECSLWK